MVETEMFWKNSRRRNVLEETGEEEMLWKKMVEEEMFWKKWLKKKCFGKTG